QFYFISEAKGYTLTVETLLKAHGGTKIVLTDEKILTLTDHQSLLNELIKNEVVVDLTKKFKNEEKSFVQVFSNVVAPLQTQFIANLKDQKLTLSQQKFLLEAFSKTRSKFHHPDFSSLAGAFTNSLLKNILINQGQRFISLTIRGNPSLDNPTRLLETYCLS